MSHQPSNRMICTALVDGLIEGLRSRPQDFCVNRFRLLDRETNQTWWIGNGFWFFSFCVAGVGSPETYLGGWNKIRGWMAYRAWLRRHGYLEGGNSSGNSESFKAAAEHLYRANEAANPHDTASYY